MVVIKKHFNQDNIQHCVSCYKCVRNCPAKAIKISDAGITESIELCLDCGKCSKICSKGVHTNNVDISEIKKFVETNNCIALLDTSFFMDTYLPSMDTLVENLTEFGFKGVETTFIGKEIHSEFIKNNKQQFYIENNCIPMVEYICKFYKELIPYILPLKSICEISAIILNKMYPKYKIVLITNCFGHFVLEDAVFGDTNINKVVLKSEITNILNTSLNKTTTENKEIGMAHLPNAPIKTEVIEGFDFCDSVLRSISNKEIQTIPFDVIDFYSCDKGCPTSGAVETPQNPLIAKIQYQEYLKNNKILSSNIPKNLKDYRSIEFSKKYKETEIKYAPVSPEAIESFLSMMGLAKNNTSHNCNLCGFETCNKFAEAVLNDMASMSQCVPHLTSINEKQSADMKEMLEELNEAFSLTFPDIRLEKKLKTTPIYAGIHDIATDYFEVTHVIEGGLYTLIITCLKLAANLKDVNAFDLIGVDKNLLVQTIIHHCNSKTQPILCVGDFVKYSNTFEDAKTEALRSSVFAKNYYNVSPNVCDIIKYHKHNESDIPKDFPKHLFPVFRTFRIIHSISSYITKQSDDVCFKFRFIDFILYVDKIKSDAIDTYTLDVYRYIDIVQFENFLNT